MANVSQKNSRTEPWSKTILGEPASKANSRKIAVINGKTRIIKSAKARAYVEYFQYQCPVLEPMFECDLSITMRIYYASRRPDLDESVILDALQGFVYRNDRQVREKHIFWGLDKENPRTEIHIEPIKG